MARPVSAKFSPRRSGGGFTLIEILIVGALIALFSGLAIFSVQQMYDSNRRKAMVGEAYQIATALSMARDDIGFYPRLHLLSLPRALVTTQQQVSGRTVLQPIPGMDTYGFFSPFTPPNFSKSIADNWRGPYMGTSEARGGLSQGGRGLVTVRLPDLPAGNDLVLWPADTWSRPWVIYQVSAALDPGSGEVVPRPITRPGENADFFNAAVSYGANGYPGNYFQAKLEDPEGSEVFTFIERMRAAALYIENQPGDLARYTMKTLSGAADPQFLITPQDFAFSMLADQQITEPDGDVGAIKGILMPGSDDVIIRF